jgi:SAM-dependent methyltransferase
MQHKILSSLIEKSWFEPAIFDTIKKYESGEEINNSLLATFLANYKTWGGMHRDMIGKELKAGIEERLNSFIELYKDIKINGYKDIAPFFVWFDDDGFIHLYDGHHRLSILRYLGIDPMVTISTDWDSSGIDPEGVKGRDFPLQEIASSIWGYNRNYHYVNDPLGRFDGWSQQRPDTEKRRDYILKKIVGNSVIDIGCSEGYISLEIAKEGYDVTGVEKGYIPNQEDRGRKLIAIARYLATLQSVKMKSILSDWKDIIKPNDVFYDNILYLSVLHNEINALGYDKAMDNLKLFRGKCRRLFIEIPDISVQKDWTYAFTRNDFIKKAERLTGMEAIETWVGYRPIILFENKIV